MIPSSENLCFAMLRPESAIEGLDENQPTLNHLKVAKGLLFTSSVTQISC